ncbi:MAG: DUF4395 domain-containing protein [Bacteroidetes bacterium]|nr:MAG: DUF4395 domain-containing protein [Bacteroidota bacterium]
MKMMKQLICPISNEYVNESVTRINALLAFLLMAAGLLFNTVGFVIFLATDFFIRAFTQAKYSPISYLSNLLVNALQLDKKNIDKAPKVFAARIGFLMSLAIVVLLLLNLNTAAIAVGGILLFFASLEFALAICVGCIVYTYLVLPFYKQ